MKLKITIEALSDICLGGGKNMTGIVDTEVITDDYGIPILPGRRIKGLFREAATELLEFGMIDQKIVDKLFGVGGGEGKSLIFQTIYPEKYGEMCEFIKHMKKQEKDLWKTYAKKEKVQEFYTAVRSQTALTEEGVAKKNTLRNIRVAKKGITFYGEIFCPYNMSRKEIELLQSCASLIRHIGTNRTRGMGNVRCTIEKIENVTKKDETIKQNIENFKKENLDQKGEKVQDTFIPVSILLKQPCILEKNYISGNILRGLYVAAYAKLYPTKELHEDELFQRLFLKNEVKFGYCWPISKKGNSEKLYFPTPCSFVQEKKSNSEDRFDLAACEDAEEIFDELDGKERCKEEFSCLSFLNDSDVVYIKSMARMENYHHRRAKDRSKGHSASESSDALDGQLYTREAICAGEEFYGEIFGPSDLLKVLKELIEDGEYAQIGASRTAEYGEVQISYQNNKKKAESLELDNKIVLTLLSPMVVLDEYGNETTDVDRVLYTITGKIPKKVHSFCREETVYGYNAKWNMPISQRNVLMPGSVFVIYEDKLDSEEMEKMNETFYGLYQNEGYGRIFVNLHGEELELSSREEAETELTNLQYKEWGCQDYVDFCLIDMIRTFCSENDSSDFCYRLRKVIERVPNANVLSGLQQICKTSANFKDLSLQLSSAADRATKKNSEWFGKIHKMIFGKEPIDLKNEYKTGNIDNEFLKAGKGKIEENNILAREYKKRMNQLLEKNSFEIFKEIIVDMIYDVHLTVGKKK